MIQQQAPSHPTIPNAPLLAPSQITITGLPSGPSAIYRGFRAQREELGDQLSNLQETRDELARELLQVPAGTPGRTGIEQRITSLDERIAVMDKQIAEADAQVAKAASVPGAIVEPPRIVREGPPEEAFIMGMVFIFVVMLPLTIAYSRRIWRRSGTVIAAFPKEIAERLGRLEQAAEATALEVERIGEGQRFLTRLFTEGPQAHALSAGASGRGSMVEHKPSDAGPAVR
ncbi:MAG TPA: hypothetical protein VES88_09115 [Gemmatimonadaceae bacterium]|nr:hypothetical protein [Gemmatimonadaceae bacterium]